MITVSPAAAEQIRQSAKHSKMEGLPLRIAAQRDKDGSIQYAMGFADQPDAQDINYQSAGITVCVPPTSVELLNGATLDYVELESGQFNFIFLNPNDPHYQPPSEAADTSHHF